jgi:hypothetical protein
MNYIPTLYSHYKAQRKAASQQTTNPNTFTSSMTDPTHHLKDMTKNNQPQQKQEQHSSFYNNTTNTTTPL